MGFAVVSRLLGLILLSAGLLKAYDLVALGSFAVLSWNDDLPILAALGEILFGSWMIVGLWPRVSWWLAVGCFLVFLGVSLDRGLAGASSCGCFGTLSIPPWYMVAVDSVAVISLWCAQPSLAARATPKWRLAAWPLLVAASAGAVFLAVPAAHLDDAGEFPDDVATITLHPDNWVGHRLPLLKHIDVGARLQRGEWLVMLYHHSCPRCQELLPQYLAIAHQMVGQYDGAQVALIEISPYKQETVPASSASSWVYGRLAGDRRWLGVSPRFLRLRDGRIESSTDSLDEVMRPIFGGRVHSETDSYYELPDYRKIRREMFLREIACGPLALLAVMRELGIQLSPDKTEEILGEAGSKGIDMLRLKELAETHGLHGLGVSVSLSELRSLNHHAVVHMNGVGFVAVVGFVSSGVRVVYPLQPAGILPDHAFERAFGQTGYALLLSPSPLNAEKLGLAPARVKRPEGPHLLLSRRVLPVGRVHRTDWETSITISNDGTESLRISEIKALCTCMSASVAKSELRPGEVTELRALGKEMLPGSFTAYVELHTNEAENAIHKIPVRGYLEQPVGFSQPAVLFENHLASQPFEFDVGLDVPPTINPRDLAIRISDDGPLQAKIVQRASGQHVLALSWLGENRTGWYRFRVDVFAGRLDGSAIAPFHVAVQIIPVVDLFPPSVAVSEDEWKSGWSRRVRCRFQRPFDGSWHVDWSDARLAGQIQATVEPRANGLDLILKSTSGKSAPPTGVYTLRLLGPDGSAHPLELLLGNDLRVLEGDPLWPKKATRP